MKCNIVIESVSKRKNSKKYDVITNDESYIMSEDTIIKFQVFKGKEFSESEFKKIIYDVKLSEYFNKVLNYLSYSLRSEYEINMYINKIDSEKALKIKDKNMIINRLKDLNYIDDLTYSKQMLDYYKDNKGRNFIKNFLKEKRIDNSIIEEVISLYSDSDEIEVGIKISNKYLQTIRKYPFRKQRQMLMNKLIRSGFSHSNIYKISENSIFEDDSKITLEKDIIKLIRKLEKKDISDYEKKKYIVSSLMSKGYEFRDINEALKNIE